MISISYNLIVKEIRQVVFDKQVDSLLQKLEFDYTISGKIEFTNYILIFLVLIEEPDFFASASNLLLRKVLSEDSNLKFFQDNNTELFETIKDNSVFPYTGIAEVIRRLISTMIYQNDVDKLQISKWPNSNFLTDINSEFLSKYFAAAPTPNITIALDLLYKCVQDINYDKIIQLSPKAIRLFYSQLTYDDNMFLEYLHRFIRFQFYGGTSRDWPESRLIVPEPFYKQIFGSTDGFLSFLNQYQKQPRISSDDERLCNDVKALVTSFESNPIHTSYDSIDYTIPLHYNLYEELQKN